MNAGKSFLAQQLFQDPAFARRVLPDGEALRTGRITWIGAERPTTLVEEEDAFIQVHDLVDLGVPYLLIDTPGTGDVQGASNRLADIALSSARIKVLVVDARTIRNENYQKFIGKGDGSLILPIVNFCKAQGQEPFPVELWREQYGRDLMEKLQAAAPAATILEPEFLPDRESVDDESLAIDYIRSRLHSHLRRILHHHKDQWQHAATHELHASHARFEARISAVLQPALGPLAQPLSEFDQALKSLPQKILHHLLDDSTRIRLLIKSHYRGLFMDGTPGLAFPYRSLAGLLLITAGAWDRLILGIGGSLPSLLAAGFKTARGQHETGQAIQTLRDKVKPLLSEMVREMVRTPLLELRHKLQREEAVSQSQEAEVDFELQGMEELAATWNLEVVAAARRTAPSRGFFASAALLGTAGFWFLFGAPLVHLYGQYIPAAITSWHGEWSEAALRTYPALTSGFWLTALALSILPALLIALCAAAFTLSRRRAGQAEAILREAMRERVENAAPPIRLVIRDPRLQALRGLFQLTAPARKNEAAQ